MDLSGQIVGNSWHDRNPKLVLRPNRIELKEEKWEFIDTDSISIKITGERFCTGFYSTETGVQLCDGLRNVKYKNSHECFKCGRHSFTYTLGTSALNDTQVKTLQAKDNYNYVNLFGKDLLKTGVASESRKEERVLEQGAFATLYFAKTDGFTARKIEEFISKSLKITQAVQTQKKLKFLNEIVSEEEARKTLESTFLQISKMLDGIFPQNNLKEHEIIYLIDNYKLKTNPGTQKIQYIEQVKQGDYISGEIKGIFGQVILIQVGEELYGIHIKALQGYVVELSNENANNVNLSAKTKEIYISESHSPKAKKEIKGSSLFA